MSDGNDKLQRNVLPIPDRPRTGLITYDAKDAETKYPTIKQLRPPKSAPNILIILLDDVGFGASSAFGGPCHTPTAERLAAGGLEYNRFHTTALCSPTRQALLTGRNHHSVGMGGITEIASGSPGYSSVLPNTASPIARTLKLNGYATAQFGKCHEVPVWETSPAGPFDAWPTGGGGFEYFYGFVGGEAHQWYPSLYEGTTPVEVKKTPEEGYHFMEDMTDKAISWIGRQKALIPDKPFFVYFAPGAAHAPHHVPKEWADKYKGKFDDGWDKLREATFARQKKLGVIPADCPVPSVMRSRFGRRVRRLFDAWPTGGGGFEYFYGFVGGEAHQWYPSLYEGTTPVEVKKTPEEGYHFMEDMTDKAISWIGRQKALIPDKPFFVYFAPAPLTRLTTSRRNGRTSTRASSTTAGTSCARRPLRGRRNSVSSLRIAS